MQLQDILGSIRSRLADPTTNRYADQDLIARINEAQVMLAGELRWPQPTISLTVAANQQTYGLPQNLGILGVYIAGQPILPTTVEDLEGKPLDFWDNTSVTNGPQWQAEPPATYPSLTYPGGLGTNATVPWYTGMRPRYFLTGDVFSDTTPVDANGPGQAIGFVPTPAGSYTANVKYIGLPPSLANYTDYSVFPEVCRMALVWWTVLTMKFGDNEDAVMEVAQSEYQISLTKARRWASSQISELQRAPRIVPGRSFFSRRRRYCP